MFAQTIKQFTNQKIKSMWTKSHSVVTKEVTKEQMWKLFSDVNNWHTWDKGCEFAKMAGKFEKGNHFTLPSLPILVRQKI